MLAYALYTAPSPVLAQLTEQARRAHRNVDDQRASDIALYLFTEAVGIHYDRAMAEWVNGA